MKLDLAFWGSVLLANIWFSSSAEVGLIFGWVWTGLAISLLVTIAGRKF